MKILIPMAGAGQRFKEEGYVEHKPAIPTYDMRTGKLLPMVVCAVLDLPEVSKEGENVIFVDRDFHKNEGVEDTIREHFPKANFITIDKLTEGQACTCLLAREFIGVKEELLIAGCDNGMVINDVIFQQLKEKYDILVFTYRNNDAVLEKPNAYGWVCTSDDEKIDGMSIKKAISDNPKQDHAVVATFWFKEAEMFYNATDKMIAEDDRINGEFYVDECIVHAMELGYTAGVFEIERYIGWGTPKDYEEYQQTFEYWQRFLQIEQIK